MARSPITVTPHQALRVAAVASIVQGLTLGYYLLKIADATEHTADKARFLIDITARNIEHLEEFDLIALRELGVIKEKIK